MVKILRDPSMYHLQLSVAEKVHKAAELGYRHDGPVSVCVFGWEEQADAIHRRMHERILAELGGE